MSEDAFIKIPGTTYTVRFGVEGKYYAVYLCRGYTPYKNKQLSILKDTTPIDLPEEIESAVSFLLDTEKIFLSPVIVNRVVSELSDRIPNSGKLPSIVLTPKAIEKEIAVVDLISKSNERAEKKSTIEHTPRMKSKYDATAEDIGKIPLSRPKQLPERDNSPTIGKKTKPKFMSTAPNSFNLEDKVKTLTNELQLMQEILTKNAKAITSLKRQITTLKKDTKTLKELNK